MKSEPNGDERKADASGAHASEHIGRAVAMLPSLSRSILAQGSYAQTIEERVITAGAKRMGDEKKDMGRNIINRHLKSFACT